MSTKRFRIAISYAGKKREYVSQVAAFLSDKFGEDRILYDKYHRAAFGRSDLAFHLPDLYEKEADLVVAVLCSDYEKKEWCGLEWSAIFGLLKARKTDEVMLTRFELVEGKGLHGLAGYLDLDDLTPAQTATHILERLALNENKPKDHYTKPPAPPPVLKTDIPHNLPRLQSFFGRTEELKQVAEALDPEARTWGVLIAGPGGMGKTSLAVRAAYACTPAQFDRIIFLSVKDREMDDDGERRLVGFLLPGFLEMLNELARELGKAEINKSAEDQRVRLLHDALREVRALLILDNLESLTKEDRDQLLTFVKRLPQGCKAILTSRRRIGSGAELLMLEQLDEAAALATLADLARHNKLLAKTSEAERRALHQQTGGKPLLLRWVAGQLGQGSCRTLDDALAFLRTCPPDNDPLEFTFGDLARDFTEAETKILCALSYFSLPAEVKHLAELAELDDAAAEIALRTLANRSLVNPDQEETNFVLVPLVADFLRRVRPEAVAETGNRLEQRAYALIVENGYQKHERFPTLDAAWPTVASALPLFIAGQNAPLQIVCDALADFLEFTGRWDEALSLCLQAEKKAILEENYDRAGRRAYEAGWIHRLREQADAVLACADRAAAYWEMAQLGASERSTAVNLRGFGYQLKKDYTAAIASHREALALLLNSAARSENIAVALTDLANAEKASGDLIAAEQDWREALRLVRLVNAKQGEAVIIGNLASLAIDQKRWLEAETLAREALSLTEKINRQQLIAADCYRLAKVLTCQKKFSEARPYAQRAVNIFIRLGLIQDIEKAHAVLDECAGGAVDDKRC